jgi:hypothetical protein
LVAEARAGGRWRRLGVQEATVDRCAAPGDGGWTGHSPEWADDGEIPVTEEADGVGYFGSWLGDEAHGRAKEEARHEAAACG